MRFTFSWFNKVQRYVGYIIMQIPSNMLLNWIGKPSMYLPVCMMIWGALSFLTGFATKCLVSVSRVPRIVDVVLLSFVGTLIIRFWLGFVEAAFFPGVLFSKI